MDVEGIFEFLLDHFSDNDVSVIYQKLQNHTYLTHVSTEILSIARRPETRPSHLICGHPTEITRAVGVENLPVAICTKQIVSDRNSLYKLHSKSKSIFKTKHLSQ